MDAVSRHIVALGGGGFSDHEALTPLDRYILDLAGSEPKVAFIPTASGDGLRYIANFRRTFRNHASALHEVVLFDIDAGSPPETVLDVDIVYVGGGSTANLLALWRLHGLDRLLTQAHRQGVVLAGVSAGGLCWFQGGVTDSFGPPAPLTNALGLLDGAFCPHWDSESERREVMERFIVDSGWDGYAVEDDVALHFVDGHLTRVVSSRPDGAAHALTPGIEACLSRPLAVDHLA